MTCASLSYTGWCGMRTVWCTAFCLESAGTVEGDLQGLARVFEFLWCLIRVVCVIPLRAEPYMQEYCCSPLLSPFHDTSGSWEKPSRNAHMEGLGSRNSAGFESFRGIRKRSSASQEHGLGHGPGSRDSRWRWRIPSSTPILTFGAISRAENLITRRSASPKETRKSNQPELTPEIVVYISGVSLIKGL